MKRKLLSALAALAVLLPVAAIESPARADTTTILGNGCTAGGWSYRSDAYLITHADGTHDWGDTDVYHSHLGSLLFIEVNGNTGTNIAVLSDPNWVGSRHYTWPDTTSHLYVADNIYLKSHFSASNGHTCDVWFYLDGHTAIRNG